MNESSPNSARHNPTQPIVTRNANTGEVTSLVNPSTGYAWSLVETKAETWRGSQKIRVVHSPGVYLVGAMELQVSGVQAFLADHQITSFTPWLVADDGRMEKNGRGSDHEMMIELSGRMCYNSYERPRPGGCAAFAARIRSEGHGSVFEHPHYSFVVSGVSRNLSLEGNRHRPLSISQLSGRFVDASEVGFVCDPSITTMDTVEWASACASAYQRYQSDYERNYRIQLTGFAARAGVTPEAFAKVMTKETERKIIKRARERARDILPGCLETRVYYTVNTRALRFILEKRCHEDAAFEIRRLFNKVYEIVRQRDPELFCDYMVSDLDDGTFALRTSYSKI